MKYFFDFLFQVQDSPTSSAENNLKFNETDKLLIQPDVETAQATEEAEIAVDGSKDDDKEDESSLSELSDI